MKRIIILFTLFLSIQTMFAQQFKVTATISGLPEGTVLQLQPLSHSKMDPTAEAVLKDGKCTFRGRVTQDVPLCVRFQIKDAFGEKKLVIDKNDIIQVNCAIKQTGESKGKPMYDFLTFDVKGSPLTDKYYLIKKEFEDQNGGIGGFRELMRKRMPSLESEITKVRGRGRAVLDSLKRANHDYQVFLYMDSIMFNKVNSHSICTMYKYGDSFWGPLMMLDTWWYFTPRERPVYEAFSEDAKNCWYGRMIREELYPGGKPGEKAPTFSIKDQQGTSHSFVSIAKDKKVVLLDFWASWCGPCRKEIPNVKKQYELYKDKGFEVISISIDKDENAWKKALDEEQLPWPNFLDREGVSNLYHVKSIPAMYLLKPDGTIIAEGMDARGEALSKRLSSMLK